MNRVWIVLLGVCLSVGCRTTPEGVSPPPARTGSLVLVDDRGRPRPRVSMGTMELLTDAQGRSLYLPPGSVSAGIEHRGLLGARITGWVLRLEPGSKRAQLRHGPVGGEPLQPAPVEPGVVVRLKEPWPLAAGRTQGIVLALRPVEVGPVRGTLELLDGDEVVFRAPFAGTVVPPRDP